MKLYVVRMDSSWNDNFVEICKTLEDVAELILDTMIEEEDQYFDKEALIQQMREREEEGYWMYLIGDFFEDNEYCEMYGWKVQVREL